MMAYQHSLAGDVAEEAGHQHPITSMGISLPMLAGNTCAWVLFNQHLDLPHLSAGWLILLFFNKCVLNIWKKKIILCTYKQKNLLLTLTCERNGSKKQRVAFIVQFVSGALKWAHNLAGLKLVFNKLGVLWEAHWLCALYWVFTAIFTPLHTLQYEIICWHQHTSTSMGCWSPAYQHQNTTYAYMSMLVTSYATSIWLPGKSIHTLVTVSGFWHPSTRPCTALVWRRSMRSCCLISMFVSSDFSNKLSVSWQSSPKAAEGKPADIVSIKHDPVSHK